MKSSMSESEEHLRTEISEEEILNRLAQLEDFREFCIQIWRHNPQLARQGGKTVQKLLSEIESAPD